MKYAEKVIRNEIRNIYSLNFHFWIGCALMLFLNTSCIRPEATPTEEEQKRGVKDVFAPGTADGIYSVKKFRVIEFPSSQLDKAVLDNKALKVKTVKTGEPAKISISTEGTFVDPASNISFVNQYYFLKYNPIGVDPENEDQDLLIRLLGKVEKFKGFPDTVYHIVPHLEDNYLILYRLSDPEKVPYDELPISIKVGDKVATPLVGYPVDYCEAEKILNANLEETGQSRPRCIGVSRKTATYIHLVEDSKAVFEYLPKVDIFPSDFFDGEWFFVKTIIKSSGDRATGFHQSFNSANLVEFDKTPDSLKVLDASGYEIDEKDQVTGFSIPVEWKEYEMARDSDIIHRFAERESETGTDITRDYFRIKFQELVQNEVSVSSSTVAETDSVFITDDYFSFTIKVSGTSNRWVKYAFKKAVKNTNYVEKRWFETDSSQFFPAFSVARKYYDRQASFHTEEDKKKFERVTRFDPYTLDDSVTVIKWYFSKQTPKDDWVRDFGRTAVDYWDKAFQEAGKGSNYKIRVVLDESTDRELGDIRYNIINLIQSPQSDAFLLGLGPNIANPITGEVLSATANVWVTNVIDMYVRLLRKYIRFHIYPPPWKPLPDSPGVTDFMHEKIKKLCASRDDNHPDVPSVTEFISDKKKAGKVFHHPTAPILGDNKVIEVCAHKIGAIDVLNTTLHEMGHGFGYRHVFSASADKDNFYENYDEVKQIFGEHVAMDVTHNHKHPAKFSSVMDYGNSQFPGLTVPGKYDIAVTKFLYFDKVDLANGGTLDIPAGADNDPNNLQKDILTVAREQSKEVKKYRVCGGKALEKSDSEIHPDDALCARWDYGTTPLEVLQNAIRNNWDSIMIGRNRYDSRFLTYRIRGGTSVTQHIPRLYNRWSWYRSELLQSKGLNLADFSFLDSGDVTRYKGLMEAEAAADPEFKLYYEITEPLFEFYKKLFFLPVKHCVYNKDGEYQAVALEIIKKNVENDYLESSRELFVDCQSPAVGKWADKNSMGSLVAEVGYLGRHTEYFLKAKQEDPYDELSIFMAPVDTMNKPVFLAQMEGKNPRSVWESLISLMQPLIYEPDFGNRFMEAQIAYLLEGTDIDTYIDPGKWVEKSEELGRDLPRPLPRILSYQIDSGIAQHIMVHMQQPVVPIDLLLRRNSFLEKLNTDASKIDSMSADKQAARRRKFGMLGFAVNQQFVDMLTSPHQYARAYPVLAEIYNEYESKAARGELPTQTVTTPSGEEEAPITVLDYLLDHPDVCVDQNKQNAVAPYVLGEESHRANLCRRFNEYSKCINEHATNFCEDIENKKAYIRFIHGVMGLSQ